MGEFNRRRPDTTGRLFFEKEKGDVLTSEPHYIYNKKKSVPLWVNFGNTGLRIALDVGKKQKFYEWDMHFTPDGHLERPKKVNGKYANISDDSLEYYKDVKFARMFAEGIRSMVEFKKNPKLLNAEPEVAELYAKCPSAELKFYTNDRMVEFAKKLLGEKYFRLVHPKNNNISCSIFALNDFVKDLTVEPGLLNKVIEFANPEKLKDIRVAQ